MLRQYGRRGTIAAVIVVFITIFALLNVLEPFSDGTVEQPAAETRIEETTQLEQETFAVEKESAGASVDVVEAAAEQDTPKIEEAQQADAAIEDDTPKNEEDQQTDAPTEADAQPETEQSTPEWPHREFPPPGPEGPSKAIVMGKMQHEETSWVNELPDWSSAIYCVDLNSTTPCPTGLKTPQNKAKEALPYLTYIVDHYAALPDIMAFVHAHRNGMPAAWHNDAPHHDAVRMLRSLRTETVRERGYVNLRCIADIGCPDEVQPFRDPPAADKHAEHAFPYFYAAFFGATVDEMRANISVVATPCCAQFAVSRAQVLQRERAFYERVREVLLETHYDDDTSGRVMEYMWHMIFGREAVHCPELFECWADVYGRRGMGVGHWRA